MILVALILSFTLQGTTQGQQAPPPATSVAQALAEGAEYLKNGDNEKALAAFERAIALNPENADAHLQKCRALAGLRRHDEAIPACTESLRLKPENTEALRDRGHYFLNLGKIDQGLADLKKAESIKKDDRGIYYHLGIGNRLASKKKMQLFSKNRLDKSRHFCYRRMDASRQSSPASPSTVAS